jgi:ribosomal protein S18 acetylase RimI-like enzyme
MVDLRPYREQEDAVAVYALWETVLGQQWPIDAAVFQQLLTGSPLYVAGDHIVAWQDDRLVGFVATQLDRSDPASGGIPALYVDPRYQRRGIGTALHEAALTRLHEAGASSLQIGGGHSRFWPGVPDNLPAAKPFFEARGWTFSELCYDLAQRMRDYQSPDDLTDDIALELALPEDARALLEFERREFQGWVGAFQQVVDAGDFDDLLLARDSHTRAIVGSLILYSHRSHASRVDGFWTRLLGDPLGEIGCVGVAKAVNGRGIGTAMVARASEILKARGVVAVHIGWVFRVNFYGRLGYAKWQAFHMGWRDLSTV